MGRGGGGDWQRHHKTCCTWEAASSTNQVGYSIFKIKTMEILMKANISTSELRNYFVMGPNILMTWPWI